jgi:hypothetical protein
MALPEELQSVLASLPKHAQDWLPTYSHNREAWNYPLARLNDPQWDKAGLVHDWRNHVQPHFAEDWHSMALETRLAIFLVADHAAGEEQWD